MVARVAITKIAGPTVAHPKIAVSNVTAAHIAVTVGCALGATFEDTLHADEPLARGPAAGAATVQVYGDGSIGEHVQRRQLVRACPGIPQGPVKNAGNGVAL